MHRANPITMLTVIRMYSRWKSLMTLIIHTPAASNVTFEQCWLFILIKLEWRSLQPNWLEALFRLTQRGSCEPSNR